MKEFRISVDIGGTFTDVVLLDEIGAAFSAKTLTIHDDLALGVCRGIEEALHRSQTSLKDASIIIHGTTVVANALIERKGVKTALLTTRGLRDQIEIATQDRYDLYDLFVGRASPLVPRELRIPVMERILADGTIYHPLDEEEVEKVTQYLRELDVQAVAVAFLHSYRYPTHERRARDIIQKLAPEILVSVSSEIVPEIREYPRSTTTCANVYVQPVVSKYLQTLETRLRSMGFSGQLLMMLSGGGTANVETAIRFPIRLLESGPVGGALTASFYSERCGFENLLVFDMGGTTAKLTLVQKGQPITTNELEVARSHRFKKGSGIPIKIPSIEMIEIGAGGGSIAHIDPMGLLKIGPESAGSDPGPACYGLGGSEATVTDADLVLGYLNEDYFLGGEMKLDKDASWDAIDEKVARPLGIGVVEAAWGIHRIVNENMATAARIHSVERGKDIRAFPIFAFGGAGPVHATGLAEALGVSRVVSPPNAGVASAFGFLTASLAFDFVQSYESLLTDQDWGYVNSILQAMEEEGTSLLLQAGLRRGDVAVTRNADMRYLGQNYEISVNLPPHELNSNSIEAIRKNFERRYQELYAGLSEALPVEILSWRVSVSGPKPPINMMAEKVGVHAPEPKGERLMYLPDLEDYYRVSVYERESLVPGAEMAGPTIVEDRDSTMIVSPRSTITMDAYRNLIATLEERKR